MNRSIAILAATLAFTSAIAKDLTVSEVQALPTRSIAERVLGGAGRLMMEVERPPSIPGQIRFFSYAFPPGSQYGICASEWTSLYLDKNGKIESIAGERRYGIEGSIYTKPDDWTYEQFRTLCKGAKSTRFYFPATDPQSALTIVAYLDAIAGRGPSRQDGYAFECTGACTDRARAFLKDIALDSIAESSAIDCDQVALYHQCFKLVLRGEPVADYPRELRIYGQMKRPSEVEITRVKLWIGTTVY